MTDASQVSIMSRMAAFAAERPDAPALTFEGETQSWSQLHRRTNRIAHALAKRGVARGDLVTIGLPNSAAFIEAAWAVWKLGATPQPVSSRLPAAELEEVIALAKPRLLIARAGAPSPVLRRDVPDLLAENADEGDLPDVIAPVFKAPTSGGSTGRPKLILSGQPGVAPAAGEVGWRADASDIMVMPGPLYHNGPFTSAWNGMVRGAHLILLPRFDGEETLRAIASNKATWVYLVPTMMSRIWRLPDDIKAKYDLSSLKTLWHLAAPCPSWLKEAFINWVGADVVMELYAGTEAQAVTMLSGGEWLAHRGSVGRVVSGEIKIVSAETGAEAAPGEVGEIYMRPSPGAPATYKYLGAEARTLAGGWESLGDIGYFDAEGYLYLADRRTDMILVGGANVYPAEIEAALDAHPLVQSSCVIGLPDDDMGARVHAIVQARPGLSEADLRAHIAGHLVTYKQPRSYEFVDLALRDDAGKVRRTQLRAARLPPR